MKTSKIKLSTLATAAFCLALFTWLPSHSVLAQQQDQQLEQEQEQDVQLGQDQEYGEDRKGKKGQKGTKMIDKDVVDRDGNRLGSISDIAVDMQNSRITYVLVSDENGEREHDPMQEDQMGQHEDQMEEDPLEQDPVDRGHEQEGMQQDHRMQADRNGHYKVVPPQALSANGDDQFTLDIDQEQWAEAPTFDKQELAQRGLDEEQGQEIYAFYDQQWETGDLSLMEPEQGGQAEVFEQDDQEDLEGGPLMGQQQDQAMQDQRENGELKFIEDLKNQRVVTHDQEEIGEVEEFLLDLEEGRLAFVVVSATNGIGQQQEGEFGQEQERDFGQDQNGDFDQEREGDFGQEQNGQYGQQGQTGQHDTQLGQRGHGDRYAIVPNAFEDSPRGTNGFGQQPGQQDQDDPWGQDQQEGQQDQDDPWGQDQQEGQQDQDDPWGQDQQEGQQDQDDPTFGEEHQDDPSLEQDGQQHQQHGQMGRAEGQLTVNISREDLENAPELKEDEWMDADMERLGHSKVFRYIEDEGDTFGAQEDQNGFQDENGYEDNGYQEENGYQDENGFEEDGNDWGPNAASTLMQDQPQQQTQDQQHMGRDGKKGHKASDLIGYDIVNHQDENLGSIEDFAIDLQNSRVVYVVVSEGGFLGIGEDLKAVPPQALSFSQEDEQFVLDIDEERWENAPTFDSKDELAEMGGEQQAQEIYAFFDQQYETGDLGLLEQDQQQGQMQQDQMQQDQDNDLEGGPFVQDGQQQMGEQRQTEKLKFVDDLTGAEIITAQQEDVGDVDDFLVDLQEGRLAFVIVNVDDDFLGEDRQQNGTGFGQDRTRDDQEEGTGFGQDQPRDDQQNGAGYGQEQQQTQQQQDGMFNGSNQYAISPSAFRADPEDENRLILEIDRQEFAQATQRIDSETWADQYRDMLGQHRVFIYEERNGNGTDWGAVEQDEPREGYREETGTHQDREQSYNSEATTGHEAGVVLASYQDVPQNQGQDRQDQGQDQDRQDQDFDRDQEHQQAQDHQDRTDQHIGEHQRGIKASEILGWNVVNQNDDNLGSINDLAIDLENNRVVYALVRSGGFLGLGAQTRVVPPQAFRLSKEDEQLVLDIEEDRWDDAPTYDKDEIAYMSDETQGQEIYAYFDQQWDDSDLGMRTDDRADLEMPQEQQQQDMNDANPAPQDAQVQDDREGEGYQVEEERQQEQQDQQQRQAELEMDDDEQREGKRLAFADDLIGNNVEGPNQEEIGEIEDFLIDLEEGRASFVIVTIDDDFLKQPQAGDADGMDTGFGDEGAREGAGQPAETEQPEDPTGQQQQQQAQDGWEMDMNGNDNRYAILISEFRLSPDDHNKLIIDQINRSDFERAETLDQRWSEMDMETLSDNKVFRFQETDDGATAGLEMDDDRDDRTENGIFRDRDRNDRDMEGEDTEAGTGAERES